MDVMTLPGLETGSAEMDRLTLSADEISALALSLAHLGAGPQAATARRALAHLAEHGGPDLAALLTPLEPETARRARVLAQAITERRVVRVHYADERRRVSHREVEPVTTLVHGDHWYLVGWCRLRHGVRAFRLERILAVEQTELPASPHRPDRFLPFQGKRGQGVRAA
ncbi:helix-turn-helix transcriptional regulator [Actinocorallia sp. A-T 12471]|uniref:helix-turn-helix transcriptional regulator n=1 Tax=Actinocorallia sp. A-T 12471 TaxID=3089813 RepID=UPI0029CF5B0A|nr:WYL domain-containing protein [Actinocorallia sp. A-T 12471]MDX6743578.1 WYL domain-containing protein [Actinocorallia sp. A-T 12471]